MWKILLSIVTLMLCLGAKAQSSYLLVDAQSIASAHVRLKVKTYCNKRKLVDYEAICAAARIVLFQGVPNTQYKKALLPDGEQTSYQQHPKYFNDFFNSRISDFISSCVRLSEFKKADKNKATLYEIEVNILQLRKDLEKNKVKRKLGL
mgnify:CR=1 FL=1|jgi:hypothetical protein